MSAYNRPVCAFVAEFRLEGTDEVILTECPRVPTHAVLERARGASEWTHAMANGEYQYACDICALTIGDSERRRFARMIDVDLEAKEGAEAARGMSVPDALGGGA